MSYHRANCQITNFGFKWGPCEVERSMVIDNDHVVLVLRTAKGEWQIRVTPSGVVEFESEGPDGQER